MGEGCVRIEKLANGYTVRARDPKIAAANAARDNSAKGAPYKPWVDPEKEFAFKTVKEVLTFLEKNLDAALKAQGGDEYACSFDMAAAEEDD